jgi:hypothetical protein
MTGPRDEFTPYWLQTAMPFGTTPLPPWLSVRIPRPMPDYLDGGNYRESAPADAAPSSPPAARGLLYSYLQPDEPWSGQSPPSIWDSSPWGTTAQAPWRSLASFPLPDNPWPTPPQSRNRFDRDDAAKSFGTGLAEGVLGVAGAFGNTREQIANGARQLTDYVAPGYGSTVRNFVSRGLRSLPYMNGPSSAEIQERIEPLTGPFYQPQTVTGDYLRTLGEFTPGLFGPGSILRNGLRNVVVPALSSETAGQLTKGTWYEPAARTIAGFAVAAAGQPLKGTGLFESAPRFERSFSPDHPAGSPTDPFAPVERPGAVFASGETMQPPRQSMTAGLFPPPNRPPRPFNADYPSGAQTDASGRLLFDIEGRPLVAQHIAGRRMAGRADKGLTPAQINAFATKANGGPPEELSNEAMKGQSGRSGLDYNEQRIPTRYEIAINRELEPTQKKYAAAHEVGHYIADVATKMEGMPTNGLKEELERVYSTLSSGFDQKHPLILPKTFGYLPEAAPHELVAEAIRAYMTNPNYLKSAAPKTAAAIRALVNSHPQLAKFIQFNGLGGLGLLGGAMGSATSADEEGASSL